MIDIPEDNTHEFGDHAIVLQDANGRESDSMCHPFLVFDKTDGTVTIADDYETSNDKTARDFVLTKPDAIKLAYALLNYAQYGATSTFGCVSQYDVENILKAKQG